MLSLANYRSYFVTRTIFLYRTNLFAPLKMKIYKYSKYCSYNFS